MATSRTECFEKTFLKNMNFLWETKRTDDLYAKAIPIRRGDGGFVVPLAQLHARDPRLKNGTWFQLSESKTVFGDTLTTEALASYSAQSPDKIFVIEDASQNKVALVSVSFKSVSDLSLQFQSMTMLESARETAKEGFEFLCRWLEETTVNESLLISRKAVKDEGFLESCGFRPDGEFLKLFHSQSDLGKQDILTAGPTISSQENSYVLDSTRYGWNSEWSKYIKRFESEFADYIGVKHALGTSSCTGALHIAFKALGIGPGDEVIVPEMTWVATASAVTYVGAKPVFADIDPKNWCIDPDKIEALITPKTKCIVPVHVYGHPADMDRVMEIANRHGLYVVEDAAPSIGAECRGRKTGSFGHFAAFSFQGAKLLVTGEGGMLTTNDPELYKRAYAIWDHGRTPGTFWINEVGVKYKMSNSTAALGLGQLQRCEEQVHAKRRIWNWYNEEFKDFDGISLWTESSWARSIYWMSSLTLNPKWNVSRDHLFAELKKRKIDTRPTFPAISQYPMWDSAENPVAKGVGEWGVNLPSGVCLKEHQVRYVAQSIKEIMTAGRK